MAQTTMTPPVAKKEVRETPRIEPFFPGLSPFGLTFGRLFEDFFRRPLLGEETGSLWMTPPVDVFEMDDTYTVKAELPGLSKEDVNITFENGVVTISGEKKFEAEKKGRNYHRIERRFGAFNRQVALPVPVDFERADATFKDGILEISIPKKEEAKAKSLRIK
jgi:HSP20 family protein